MLGRLSAWWRSRGRCIYSYHDGHRRRYVDPVVVHRALRASAGAKWEEYLETLASSSPMPGVSGALLAEFRRRQDEAVAAVVKAARAAFGVQAVDANARGLSEAETIALVADYFNFLGGLASEGEGPFGWTLPPPVSPSTPAGCPIGPSSPSGSNESASPEPAPPG